MEAAGFAAMETTGCIAMEATRECMRGEATTHVLRRFGRVLRSLETRSASRRIRTDDAAVIEAGEGARSKAGCGVDLRVADEGRRRRRTTKFANMRHGRVLGGHAGVC